MFSRVHDRWKGEMDSCNCLMLRSGGTLAGGKASKGTGRCDSFLLLRDSVGRSPEGRAVELEKELDICPAIVPLKVHSWESQPKKIRPAPGFCITEDAGSPSAQDWKPASVDKISVYM